MGGVLDVELDTYVETTASRGPVPGWISRVYGMDTRPLHAVCSAVWLLQFAKAVVMNRNILYASFLVPWWRIIRYTTYVMVSLIYSHTIIRLLQRVD